MQQISMNELSLADKIKLGISNNDDGPPWIMTFVPSYEEFKDFSKYIELIESVGAHLGGIAKIIPPSEWVARKSGYNIDDINMTIPAPISQVMSGTQGAYQQINMVQRAMTLRQFEEISMDSRHITPWHNDYDDLERKYWKNVSYVPPLYAADIRGTLSDPDLDIWNINKLSTILDYVEEDYGIEIDGVNTAYLYFGMWKSSFAWHTEDMDLYSINYLHFGAPKTWYAVAPQYGRQLEALAKRLFPDNFKECPSHLRHKMTMISPRVLKHNNVPYNRITQEPGQIIITFPFGYHAGYNHGFNGAESTNFATKRWIEYGKRARLCQCRSDMVKISMETFVKRFQPEKYENWLSGEDYGCHPEEPNKKCFAPPPTLNVYKKRKSKKNDGKTKNSAEKRACAAVESSPTAEKNVLSSNITLDKTCRVVLNKLDLSELNNTSTTANNITGDGPSTSAAVNNDTNLMDRFWNFLPSNGLGKNLLTNGIIKNTKRVRVDTKLMLLEDDEDSATNKK